MLRVHQSAPSAEETGGAGHQQERGGSKEDFEARHEVGDPCGCSLACDWGRSRLY